MRGGMIASACALLIAGSAAAGEPVAYAEKPTASVVGKAVKIEFALSRPTDVAVAIVDREGTVVRHLAAGVLGENAPAPFAKGALRQSLTWDRTDDAGRPVTGPCSVRVSAGLMPTFDKMLGHAPGDLGSVVGLAVGPTGDLFVWDVFGNVHPNDGSATCRVFDRSGKYLRTIVPYPADVKADAMKGLRRLTMKDGRVIPFIYQGETRSFYPGVGNLSRQRPIVTRDGRVVTVGIQELGYDALRYAQSGPTTLVIIRADGTVPDPVVGPLLHPRCAPSFASPSLALSPDEKTIYSTGFYVGSEERGDYLHAVYRCAWNDKEAALFIGDPKQSGSDGTHLNDPTCVATDAKGNLYVSDWRNDRVAVFNDRGASIGAIAVKGPIWVDVHRKSGAVYVLAGSPPNQLIKFDGYSQGRELARFQLPNTIDGGRSRVHPVMAVDGTGETPVVWVGAPTWYCRFTLLRFEERDGGFGQPREVSASAALGRNLDVYTHPTRDEVYTAEGAAITRFDGRTGKREALNLPMPEPVKRYVKLFSVGGDGHLYVWSSSGKAGLYRFDRDLKPVPFASTGTNALELPGSLRLHGRGLTTDAAGNLYVLYQKSKEQLAKGDAQDANDLALYDAGGTLKNAKLIDSEIRSINSVRVDPAGNIYLAVGARPDKVALPEDFAGMDLGTPWKYGANSNELNWYQMMYGSIAKFGPEGGAIRTGIGGRPLNYAFTNTTEVKGALWLYPQASVVASWRTKGGTPDTCLCEVPCFGLDRFGRSYFPDAARFQVGVLDSNGNEICRFGDYGNLDSAGPGSAIPQPAIPITWVHGVAASDEAVYVGDRLARRLVRVKLDYEVSATCAVP